MRERYRKIGVLWILLCFISFIIGCGQGEEYQPPTSEWVRGFGGSGLDVGYYVQQTTDGGYIIVGKTLSSGAGLSDIYLVKVDADGNEEWQHTYGGEHYDDGFGVQQTLDGGFIITGSYSPNLSDKDAWLIKTNGTGHMMWNYTFGGYGNSIGHEVKLTTDGGYIVVGEWWNTSGSHQNDIWLMKTDANGNEEWSRTFSSFNSKPDIGYSVEQTIDGGFIVTGKGLGYESKVWLIKTDKNGHKQWDNDFIKGPFLEGTGQSVLQTQDNGYVIVGTTLTSDKSHQVWVIKTYINGTLQWERDYGGKDAEVGYAVVEMDTGDLVIAGSKGSDGNEDGWLLKIDANGVELWNTTFGAQWGADKFHMIDETQDGGFILTGQIVPDSLSYANLWLVKIKRDEQPPSTPTIVGASAGLINQEQEFLITSTDPAGHNIYYFIDWGDGKDTGWIGPYASAQTISVNHIWTAIGSYSIKARAKNSYDDLSDWSEQHPIDITALEFEITTPAIVNEGEPFTISVKQKGTNNPVPDAMVVYDNQIQYTDNAGTVIFTASLVDTPTLFDISVSKDGFLPGSASITVLNLPDFDLIIPSTVIEKESFTIQCSVTGNPLVGVQISFNNNLYLTNTEGKVVLTAPAVGTDTEYIITVIKEGYRIQSHIITILEDQPIETGGWVIGTVTDTEQRPLHRALVCAILSDIETKCTFTDEAGVYSLSLAPGSYPVYASKEGYVTERGYATTSFRNFTFLNFSLEKSTQLDQIIQDTNEQLLNEKISEEALDQNIGVSILLQQHQKQIAYFIDDLSVDIQSSTEEEIRLLVSAEDETPGTIIVIRIGEGVLADLNNLIVFYDGEDITETLLIDEFFDFQNSTNASWIRFLTINGLYVLVYIPHFSEHVISINSFSIIEGLDLISSVILYGVIALIVMVFYIVPIVLVNRRK